MPILLSGIELLRSVYAFQPGTSIKSNPEQDRYVSRSILFAQQKLYELLPPTAITSQTQHDDANHPWKVACAKS